MYTTIGQNYYFAVAVERDEPHQTAPRLVFHERYENMPEKAKVIIARYDGKKYKTFASAKRAAKNAIWAGAL